MTEQEIKILISRLDKIIDSARPDVQKETALQNAMTQLENFFTSDKSLESENMGDQILLATNKLQEIGKKLEEKDKEDNETNKLAGITTTQVNPYIAKLRAASSKLTELQERIADAKLKDFDFEACIDAKKDEYEELEESVKELEEEYQETRNPLRKLKNNDKNIEYQKIKFTIEKYKEYNKIVKDIAAEKAKPASEQRDANIAELEAKRDNLKNIITSNECVKFNNTDTIEVVNAGGSVTTKTFKQVLDENGDLSLFLTGTVKDSSGNTIENLDDRSKNALEALKNEIQNNTDLAKLKQQLLDNGFDFTTDDLDEKTLSGAREELEKKKENAKRKRDLEKNTRDAKKKVIDALESDRSIIEDDTLSVEDIWSKFVSSSDRTALETQSSTWKSRFEFWRGQGKNPFSAFFSSFRKNNTLNTMKYVKVEEVKREAKDRKKTKQSVFRRELVKLAAKKDEKVNDTDIDKAYEEVDRDVR